MTVEVYVPVGLKVEKEGSAEVMVIVSVEPLGVVIVVVLAVIDSVEPPGVVMVVIHSETVCPLTVETHVMVDGGVTVFTETTATGDIE